MAKRLNWDNVNKVNKGISKGFNYVSDELPLAGSYADMRRYCLSKGAKCSSDDPESRLPRPKGKNEPSGPKIILVKGGQSTPRIGSSASIRRNKEKNSLKTNVETGRKSLGIAPNQNKEHQPVHKAEIIKRRLSRNSGEKSFSKVHLSRVKQLENELVQLVNFIGLINVKKSSTDSCRNLLEKIYNKIEELIEIDPLKSKSPLSIELQKAYDKLRSVV